MAHVLDGTGGVASEELNATVMDWPPGAETPLHRNEERDVLLVVLAGSVVVRVDGAEIPRGPGGETVVIEKGAARQIVAGPEGARILTAHRRRDGLMPSPAAASSR
jgi:quercetin dioxygenase-like cupin family protein